MKKLFLVQFNMVGNNIVQGQKIVLATDGDKAKKAVQNWFQKNTQGFHSLGSVQVNEVIEGE